MKSFTITFSMGSGYSNDERVSESIQLPDELALQQWEDARVDFRGLVDEYRKLIQQRIKTLEINAKARE